MIDSFVVDVTIVIMMVPVNTDSGRRICNTHRNYQCERDTQRKKTEKCKKDQSIGF